MFSKGDKIVHPMHGAGVVEDIVSKKMDGASEEYYALKLLLGDVLLFIPVAHSDEIGLRAVCGREEANKLLADLADIQPDADQSWNRRYRENMLRIRSGNAGEVAKVVKNLLVREKGRSLSTGEKKMLLSARQILTTELALALDISLNEMEQVLNEKLCP